MKNMENTIHAINVATAESIIGIFILIEVTNAAMRGGTDCASDCIDWFIPSISPCLSTSVIFEITAEVFG